MRRTTVMSMSAAAFVVVGLIGCSSAKKGSSSVKDKSADAATATGPSTPSVPSDDERNHGDDPAAAALASGMPSFCSYTPAAVGAAKACFSCVPRAIPITGCGTLTAANFDPAKDCKGDTHSMQCALGGAAPFTMNFDNQTLAELAYGELPLLITAAKAFITAQLNAKEPQLVTTLSSVLDLVAKDKDLLFKPGDVTPFINELEGILKTTLPIVSAIDVGNVKSSIAGIVSSFRSKAEDQAFSLNDIMTLVTAIGGQIGTLIPGSAASSLLSGLDINALLGMLGSSTTKEHAALYGDLVRVHHLSLTIH